MLAKAMEAFANRIKGVFDMRGILAVAVMFLFSVASADDTPEHIAAGGKKGENFEAHKKEMLENVDKRIQGLQEHKTCVSAAANHDAMKACHEKMKDMRMDLKEAHMGKKHERMEKRMEQQKDRWEKRKNKMSDKSGAPDTGN
jgi:hypothetical protein